jgi:hypothetical protein
MPFIGGVWLGAAVAAAVAGAAAGMVCATAHVVIPTASAIYAIRLIVACSNFGFVWVIFRSSRYVFGEFFLAS